MKRSESEVPVTKPVSLAALHRKRLLAQAKEDEAAEKAKALTAKRKAIEDQILTVVRAKQEQGLAASERMKDGCLYSLGNRRPWGPVDKERVGEVTAELVRLGRTEFLGSPKYGELKTEYGQPDQLPGKLKDLVVQNDAFYLSITTKG